MYNKNHDGLTKDWVGRVWLNPPYSRPLIEQFVRKLAQHGNGIALLFNRCDSKMFQDIIFEKATAIKFLRGRIRFFRPDGIRGGFAWLWCCFDRFWRRKRRDTKNL